MSWKSIFSTGCKNISSPCVTASSSISNTSDLYLTYLDLSDCPRVTDEDLKTITGICSNLCHLYLRRCTKVTGIFSSSTTLFFGWILKQLSFFSDVGLKHVSTNCLRELSVSDCPQVTDFGLFELAKLGPVLRYLSLAKCGLVTDSGLCQLVSMCYKLRLAFEILLF